MSELATFCEELERAVNRIEGVAWVEATPETAMIVHRIEDAEGEPRDPLRHRSELRMTETAWQRRTRREAARAAYVAEHGNFCELCGNEPKSRGLSEDHDHKTGAHRGWLCFRCNRALPAYVTLEWLRKAVAYLERAGSASAAADEGEA